MCMNTHTCTRKHAHTHAPLPRGPFLRVGAHLLMSSPRRNAASPLPPPAADCAISRGPGYTKAGRFPAAGAGALSSLKPPPWFLAPTPVFIFWLHPHSCLAAGASAFTECVWTPDAAYTGLMCPKTLPKMDAWSPGTVPPELGAKASPVTPMCSEGRSRGDGTVSTHSHGAGAPDCMALYQARETNDLETGPQRRRTRSRGHKRVCRSAQGRSSGHKRVCRSAQALRKPETTVQCKSTHSSAPWAGSREAAGLVPCLRSQFL